KRCRSGRNASGAAQMRAGRFVCPGTRQRRKGRPGAAWPRRVVLIAALAGTLAEKSPERLVIDVGGVGYAVHVSLQTFTDLPPAGGRRRTASSTRRSRRS